MPIHGFEWLNLSVLKGKELGAAVDRAIQLKIDSGLVKSKAAVARDLDVEPNVVYGWIRTGSISKERLPRLWEYFSDVVGPDHWGISAQGMSFFQRSRTTSIQWPFELTQLDDVLGLTPEQLEKVDLILSGVVMGMRSQPGGNRTIKRRSRGKDAA